MLGRLLRAIVQAFRISGLWDRALDLNARGELERSLEALEEIGNPKFDPGKPKTMLLAVERPLLKAMNLVHLYRGQEALSEIIYAQRNLLLRDPQSEEIKYLKCYAGLLLHDALVSADRHNLSSDVLALFNTHYADVNLRKVPAYTKRTFPMPFHPDWPAAPSPH